MQTPNSIPKIVNLRIARADHHDRMARLSDAYAAAFEGDVQFSAPGAPRTYILRRARAYRKDAETRRAKARALRQIEQVAS